MSESSDQRREGGTRPATSEADIGGVVIAVLLVVVGAVTLIDTADYLDTDSVVFPRAAAIMLIVCSVLVAVGSFVKGDAASGFGTGHWWRRLLLVGGMIVTCLLMPLVSFLPAVAVSFVTALIAATHERVSVIRGVSYVLASVVIVLGFYVLFRYGLKVPLPSG
ncbi:MAG: tripartite tricarboxylate transporter TctB family protein [Burkholderiaceae bacterium]